MSSDAWRVVRDLDRGRVLEIYVVCPSCWSTKRDQYRQPRSRPGWTTEVRVIAPQRLSATEDECYSCGAHPERIAS